MDKEKLKQELIKFAEWQENTILPDTNEQMINDYLKQYVVLPQADISGSSFDDVKFIDALFAEYNKSYKETKAGQVYPRWLDDEQLKWVLTVAKNCH